MTFHAVVVAAGSGSRAGGPKQWRVLAGKPVVRWSVEALLDAGAAGHSSGDPGRRRGGGAKRRWPACRAGSRSRADAERAHSVRNGLEALAGQAPERVLVHDAARPFLTRRIVNDLVDALETSRGRPPRPAGLRHAQAGEGRDGDGHGPAR